MTEPVILDVRDMSVSADGVDDFVWPVERSRLERLERMLLKECTRKALSLDDEESNLALILLPFFIIEVVAIAEASLADAGFRASGRSPRSPDNWRIFQAIQKRERPTPSPFLASLASGPVTSPRWRVPLRRLWNMKTRDAISRRTLSKVDLRGEIVVTTVEPVVLHHAACIPETVTYGRYDSWFGSVDGHTGAEGEPIPSMVEAALDLVESTGVPLPSPAKAYLRDWWFTAAALADLQLQPVVRSPGDAVPRRLWTGTGGNVWGRLLRHAVGRRGGHVTGHDHAIGTGHRVGIDRSVTEFLHCDVFVTLNERQAKQLTWALMAGDLALPTSIAIEPLPRRTIKTHRHARRAGTEARIGRRLMVLSTIYRGDRYHNATVMADIVAVDFQARLFAKLCEWGYEVLHKHHPASPLPPPSSFERELGVTQVAGSFESVMQRADAFLIIDDSNSSVIGPALASQKPVTIIDFNRASWAPEALHLLQRRCTVIDGAFDEENRATVDWAHLREALIESVDLMDPAIFDEFFRLSCRSS